LAVLLAFEFVLLFGLGLRRVDAPERLDDSLLLNVGFLSLFALTSQAK
jgi:hypothetical protein